VIAHVCNDIGGWGKGFVLAISRRWPEPEEAYRKWHAGQLESSPPCLLNTGECSFGEIQLVQVEESLFVANMVGQRGIRRAKSKAPIRYEAVAQCLEKLGEWASENQATVHMPRLGCGLAGGEWSEVEPLLLAHLCERDIEVTVYDFE